MGAQISQKKKHFHYGKVRVSDEYDEEDPLCIGLQIVESEPEVMKTPLYITQHVKPDEYTLQAMTQLKMELCDSLDRDSNDSLCVFPITYNTKLKFEDCINFLRDKELRRQQMIPLVLLDSTDALGENTSKKIELMRKSVFYSYRQGIPCAVALNNVVGPAYFSDVSTCAWINDKQYTGLGAMTSLPVLCSTAELVKMCRKNQRFWGVAGDSTLCSFNATGNPRTYDFTNTQCTAVFSHSSSLGHHVLPLAEDVEALSNYLPC